MTNKNHTTDIKNNSNGIVDLHHRMYDSDDKKENPEFSDFSTKYDYKEQNKQKDKQK